MKEDAQTRLNTAHGVLSVKLCELDEKIGRMRSRIYFTENARHSQVKQEIEAMEKECAEEELTLRKNLQFSKAPCVSLTAKAYEEIELIIQRAKKEDFSAEEKILLAEYALDFAMQAADRALLSSLKAIDAQMTQQEQDERSFP